MNSNIQTTLGRVTINKTWTAGNISLDIVGITGANDAVIKLTSSVDDSYSASIYSNYTNGDNAGFTAKFGNLINQSSSSIIIGNSTLVTNIPNLASTNSRLLSSSSTGQLTPITDGTSGQVLGTNGSGVYSFIKPEITSLASTGAGANQVATANGSNAVTFQTLKTINSTSLFGAGNIIAGDVFKVSTPIDNQLGVWTGDGTIEGTTKLKFGAFQSGLEIGDYDGFSRIGLDNSSGYGKATITYFGNYVDFNFPNYSGSVLKLFNNGVVQMPSISAGSASEILYYNTSDGTISHAVNSGGSGMTNPMTTTGDIIYSSSGSTPARRGIGTSGQILTVSSGLPVWANAPSGTSQWTTDTNGITYANNVGIGVASASNIGLYVSKATSNGGYVSYMNNTNANAGGLGIQTTANSSVYPILSLIGNTSTTRFNFLSDGTFYASSAIGNTSTPYNLYFDPANGKITYASTSSGGSGTVTSVSASTILTGTGGNFATVTVTNPTTTPNIAYTLSDQTANKVLRSPNGSSGKPYYDKIEIADHSATGTPSSSTFYRGDNTWATVASGGIPYPSGSGIPLVSGGSSWGTTIALPGGTTSFLRADGTFATPSSSYTLPLATSGTRGGIQIGYTASGATIPVLLSSERAYVSLTRYAIEMGIPITPYSGTTLDTDVNSNIRTIATTNITITLSNLVEGRTGNVEITYNGASVVTFNVGSGNVLNVAPNIYNSTTNTYTKSVLTKSSGTAIYSYYVSGTNVYLTGTQSWN